MGLKKQKPVLAEQESKTMIFLISSREKSVQPTSQPTKQTKPLQMKNTTHNSKTSTQYHHPLEMLGYNLTKHQVDCSTEL